MQQRSVSKAKRADVLHVRPCYLARERANGSGTLSNALNICHCITSPILPSTHTHAVPFIKKIQNWWDFIWLFLSHLVLPQINEHLWNFTFCFSCFNGSLLKIQFSTDTLAPVIPITHFCTSSKVPWFIPKPGPYPWISLTLLTSRPETQSSSAQLYNVKSHRFNTVSLRK